ncbi:MAG: RNA pseudouridine synthase [Candidatus Omnitrophica bacterium]|nr:RNA pseudouridine synthase [Candidatus Omnitrophota bacterium]
MDGNYRYKINNIGVVYEDNYLLVVDKPSGLITIPAPRKNRSLTSILNDYFRKRGSLLRLYPCHRLDQETSGLIIYSKGKSIQKMMMRLFKEKKVKKIYIGFVQGKMDRLKGKITFPIEGKSATTEYQVLQVKKDFSIVEIFPLTGRRNQIRIHFKRVGHPLIGEDRFCFRRDFKLKYKRLCLHAKALNFVHPISGKLINLEIDLSEDLKKFLDKHA